MERQATPTARAGAAVHICLAGYCGDRMNLFSFTASTSTKEKRKSKMRLRTLLLSSFIVGAMALSAFPATKPAAAQHAWPESPPPHH